MYAGVHAGAKLTCSTENSWMDKVVEAGNEDAAVFTC